MTRGGLAPRPPKCTHAEERSGENRQALVTTAGMSAAQIRFASSQIIAKLITGSLQCDGEYIHMQGDLESKKSAKQHQEQL